MSETIIIFGSIAFALLATMIIAMFLFFEKRHFKELNKIHQLGLETQQKVITAIIDTQEIERKRLSEDLHDELGAMILALQLSNHRLLTTDFSGKIKDTAAKNEDLIEQIAIRVREISHDLLPPSLRSGHLEIAIQYLCSLFKTNLKMDISFHRDEENSKIPLTDQVALYRVLNEWFSNIVKHSEAGMIRLDFHKNSRYYVLKISDNGTGFDYEKANKSSGLGLTNMKGRLTQMGATYTFRNNVPVGTILEIKYPITQM